METTIQPVASVFMVFCIFTSSATTTLSCRIRSPMPSSKWGCFLFQVARLHEKQAWKNNMIWTDLNHWITGSLGGIGHKVPTTSQQDHASIAKSNPTIRTMKFQEVLAKMRANWRDYEKDMKLILYTAAKVRFLSPFWTSICWNLLPHDITGSCAASSVFQQGILWSDLE